VLPRGANSPGVSRTNCAIRSFPCRLPLKSAESAPTRRQAISGSLQRIDGHVEKRSSPTSTLSLAGSAIFPKMPAPQFVRVNVNEALRNAVRLFEPQFNEVGKPTITPELFLTEPLPDIDADPDLLPRAFQNLVLNALDAMPGRRNADPENLGAKWQRSNRSSRHGKRTDAGRMLAAVHAVLHDEVARDRLGLAILQSVVSESSRHYFSDERRGPRHNVSN